MKTGRIWAIAEKKMGKHWRRLQQHMGEGGRMRGSKKRNGHKEEGTEIFVSY